MDYRKSYIQRYSPHSVMGKQHYVQIQIAPHNKHNHIAANKIQYHNNICTAFTIAIYLYRESLLFPFKLNSQFAKVVAIAPKAFLRLCKVQVLSTWRTWLYPFALHNSYYFTVLNNMSFVLVGTLLEKHLYVTVEYRHPSCQYYTGKIQQPQNKISR